MKNLNEYITGQLRPVPDSNEMLPNINEHLKSLEPDIVLRQLNRHFSQGKMGARFRVQATSGGSKPILQLESDWEMHDNDELFAELMEQLDLMMWFITMSYDSANDRKISDKWVFQIEPVMAEDVSDYIYNQCGGIVYHITTSKGARDIKSTALRIRQSKYRYFPKRSYVVGGANDVMGALEEVLKTKIPPGKTLEWGKSIYRVLKIDVSGTNINFYHDGYYDHKGIAYAYTNFPSCKIKEVKWHEIQLMAGIN